MDTEAAAGSPDIRLVVFGRDYFSIEPRESALIVVDMQNSFVAEGAMFSTAEARSILPNVDRLIAVSRERGLPVVWTQSDHSPPGGGLVLARSPAIRETRELWRGDSSFDLYPGMTQPVAGEHRVVKHKYDAFHDTDLDAILRNSGVDTLIIAGVTTECCCESTARGAFSRDYKVAFVRDAMASLDPAAHEQACERVDLLFGRAVTTAEVVRAIAGGGEQPAVESQRASRASLSRRVASTSTAQPASSITTP